MTKLNIGMIGAGFIGQLAHLMNFIEVANCNVRAVAEFKPELRRKVAARYDIPHAYASHTDLLKDPEIDAVVVVTPRPYTGPVVLDCLNAGKHVLSEKPMTGSSEQAKVLLDAAKANKVKYAVGYMKRYDEGVEVAKKALSEALQTGSLGTLSSVYAKCYMGNSYCNPYGHVVTQETADYPSTGGWPIAPEWLPAEYHQGFGAYLNTYSHVTNLLRYLFDHPTPSVEFVNLTDHAGQLVVLGFNNFLATLETGKISHRGWSEEVRITFTDGEIALFLPPALLRNIPASVEIYRAGKIQEQIRPLVNWSWAFRRQAEGFVSDIIEQKPMRNSAEEAYKDILLTETIWEHEMQRLEIRKAAKRGCSMIKTAIIGATGYIGTHLLRKYRETFADCIGTGFSRTGQGLTSFDLRNPNIANLRLQETGHEAVLIASAMPNIGWCESHPKESYELNVKGTLELVKQLGQTSLTTLFLSSDYVFNGETGQYSDQAATNPITEYGRQKAAVEREIPNLTDNYAILRLSKIYGTTWKDGTLLDGLAAALIEGQKLTVATDQFFSPTHVDDVVAMTLFAQEQGVKGLVNLCHANHYSRYQLALKLAEALQVSPALLQSTSLHAIPTMENRPLNTSLLSSPLFQKINPSFMSMEEAIKCVALNWKSLS